MFSPIHLIALALCFLYFFQLILLSGVYQCFWRNYKEEQTWLNLCVLMVAALLWPIVIPIAYIRLLEEKTNKESQADKESQVDKEKTFWLI
ncbi:MAG: hypothetical protein AAGE59_27665 [Cyanobacteria bacterium P01_F01_bin.86]